jgi:hypothetical protein
MFMEYLKRVELNPSQMHQVQYLETRRAFFAGVQSMSDTLAIDWQDLSEEEMLEEFGKVRNECINFWLNENNKFN